MIRLVPDAFSSVQGLSNASSAECPAAGLFYVENYGCAANSFDLGVINALLINAGYRPVSRPDQASVVVVNTCGVKKPTEDRIIGRIRLLNQINKPLVIAGCLPKINLEAVLRAAPNFSAILDPWSVDKILLAVEEAVSGGKNRIYFSQKPIQKLDQPRMRLNSTIEIVQVSEGCTRACAFCCVRLARGALFSYPVEKIVRRITQAVSEGANEVWLTSQDNGAYGLDIGTNIAELLYQCCQVAGKFLIRVGMMNPDHVLGMLPELVRAYKQKKVFKFLHVPIQSGDDETLKRMNRGYTVDEFETIVNSFREVIPRITLSTDVICGFPGEGREAFGETLKIINKTKPDIVNISKFFPRPNTPAEKMERVDPKEVKDRSRELTKLAREISSQRNRTWLGWEGEMLVDEKGKDFTWVGRNFAYKPVVVKSDENLAGKFVRARVVEFFSTYLGAVVT